MRESEPVVAGRRVNSSVGEQVKKIIWLSACLVQFGKDPRSRGVCKVPHGAARGLVSAGRPRTLRILSIVADCACLHQVTGRIKQSKNYTLGQVFKLASVPPTSFHQMPASKICRALSFKKEPRQSGSSDTASQGPNIHP